MSRCGLSGFAVARLPPWKVAAAAMRSGSAAAVRKVRRAAHAIALHAGLGLGVGLALRVEEADERRGVTRGPVRCQGGGEGHDLGAILGLGEVERAVDDRRPLLAVEGVRNEHDVALRGEPPPHLAEHRTQPEDVRPDEHGRPFARAGRMEEDGVGRAVGRPHLDVRLGDIGLRACGRRRQRRARHRRDVEGTARDARILSDTLVNAVIAHALLRPCWR